MAQDEASSSGPRMIDGGTMERVRTLSVLIRQLGVVREQLTEVRDGLVDGDVSSTHDDAVIRGCIGELTTYALALVGLVAESDQHKAKAREPEVG
jgi:hypothetical protein